jgi:hypothetical protein
VATAAWVALAILVVGFLVGLAYLIGRGLWHLAEPGDDDPGGKESPPPALDPNIWTGTPFVEYLRLSRRLRKSRNANGRKADG